MIMFTLYNFLLYLISKNNYFLRMKRISIFTLLALSFLASCFAQEIKLSTELPLPTVFSPTLMSNEVTTNDISNTKQLDGKKTKKEFKHIVIDEAQDYSMLQFMVLKKLTGCKI